ncbi:hypothetical protein [Peribacillus simplex]
MFADLVLVNGQVITSNMENDVNEAVAVLAQLRYLLMEVVAVQLLH